MTKGPNASLSRWAKDHKHFLRKVDFQDPKTADPNWRQSRAYRRWREFVLTRDDFCCQMCGATTDLSAHHIVPASVCPDLRYEVWNGVTLCAPCHQKHGDFLHRMRPRFWRNFARKRRR